MITLYFKPEEVWDFFLTVKDDIEKPHLIGKDDGGNEVWMTPRYCEEDGFYQGILPEIEYLRNGSPEGEEFAHDGLDCFDLVKDYYDCLYEDPEEDDDDYLDLKIEDREEELSDAVRVFLGVIVENDLDFDKYCDEKTVEKLKDRLLSIVDKEGIPIYRPTMLTREDGSEVYVEFPYRFLKDETPPGT